MSAMARARRAGRVARALVAACVESAPKADPIGPPKPPTWASRLPFPFRSAPRETRRAFHSIPSAAAWTPWAPTTAFAQSRAQSRAASRLITRDARDQTLPTRRYYFAGHPQIKNAEGQDMAQVRAGVRLRKALCAVLEHPSVSHRFEGLGLTILEVRMAKDFKKAHVRWTVADVDEDDEYASHAPSHAGVSSSSSSSSFTETRRRFASNALRRNATRLRSMASKMLRSKHTPRLVFVDDDARSVKERELDAAFDRAADEAARNDAYAAEVKAREAEVLASARRRDGTSDLLGPYDDDALDETDETDETDGSLMGYAFEMHDGSTPYVSDFDDAVDALVAEMSQDAVRAEEGEEEDGEWFDDDEDDDEYDGDDEDDDDDDDDEYVEGDEFDDDDDDEAEDFDFDKFDEAERRTRR